MKTLRIYPRRFHFNFISSLVTILFFSCYYLNFYYNYQLACDRLQIGNLSDSVKINNIKIMRDLGPTSRKILLLLEGGLVLSLTRRPDAYFRIIKKIAKEWKKINERKLRDTIKRLYKSKLIDYTEEKDGSIILKLSENGKKRILKYNLDEIEIKKPKKWDSIWRMVIFDIPEVNKRGRTALTAKLKEMGFYHLQKSVFIHPYECKNEIDFIAEIFNLAPFIRFARVRDIDVELDLKQRFNLR